MGWKACRSPLGRAGRQAGRQVDGNRSQAADPIAGAKTPCLSTTRARALKRRGKPRTRLPVRVWSIVVRFSLLFWMAVKRNAKDAEADFLFPSVAEPGASPEQQHGQRAGSAAAVVVVVASYRRPSSVGRPLSGCEQDVLAVAQPRQQHAHRTNTRTRAHRCPYLHLVVAFPPLPLPGEKRKGGGRKETWGEGGWRGATSRVTCPSLCLYK